MLRGLTFDGEFAIIVCMKNNAPARKPVVFMTEDIKTPPMSQAARREAGFLVGRLQEGVSLGMPLARPVPSVGRRCLELRVTDENVIWRIMCRVDSDAIIVIHSFAKKTEQTPQGEISLCKKRLAAYDAIK